MPGSSRLVAVLTLLAVATGLVVLAVPPPAAPAAPAPPAAPAAAAAPAALPPGAVAGQGRPLVIVLDTSASMDEEDGAGTIKLAGAQVALAQVIRQQRPGSRVGLWTYPSGSCGPGDFAIPVQDLQQRQMINTIQSLTAAGDTPTGEALRGVADALTAAGYEGATILLISDGESNCSSTPCETAQEIVAEGFDLTVQAAGFQISGDGLRELECIASATGGQVFEATDSDELNQVITDATKAELTMTVEGVPSRTPAGSASRVKVTVTNESAVDVQNARIAMDFGAGNFDSLGVIPAALPPLVRVGNIPAGTSSARDWVISYGSRGKTGTASWRISAWGSNAQPQTRFGKVDVVSADQTLADADGPIADLDGKRIAILGDSFSSGEGAGSYLEGTDRANGDDAGNTCHKSTKTYLYPLFESAADVELIACSGATSHYIGGEESNGLREEQVPTLRRRLEEGDAVDAAFLTIGGNDIGFGDIIMKCVVGHPRFIGPPSIPGALLTALAWDRRCSDEREFVDLHNGLIEDLGPELRATYRLVSETLNTEEARAKRGGEVAPLYVLAYPQVFPERQWAPFCAFFDAEEIAYANTLVDSLNAKIEQSVAQVRDDGWRVQMVTTTQESFLPDNTACPRPGSQAFMNGLNASSADLVYDAYVNGKPLLQELMHPSALGYRAETNTILAWSSFADDARPEGLDEWRTERDASHWNVASWPLSDVLLPPLPSVGPAVLDASAGQWTTDPMDVRGGQELELEVHNAAPHSTVQVVLQSRSRLIGSVEVGADGSGIGTVLVPRGVASGTHRLTAVAFDSANNPVVASQEVDVARAIPLWLLPLAALTLALFLSWLLCRRWDRRIRATAADPQ